MIFPWWRIDGRQQILPFSLIRQYHDRPWFKLHPRPLGGCDVAMLHDPNQVAAIPECCTDGSKGGVLVVHDGVARVVRDTGWLRLRPPDIREG